MTFDFDEEVPRIGSQSVKWGFDFADGKLTQREEPQADEQPLLQMWVADMDFRCPQAVTDALTTHAWHGVFGYGHPTNSYFTALAEWMERRHGWSPDRDWVLPMPGIVPTLNMLVTAFAGPGEKVLVQRPVYHQFMHAIENQGREVVSNSLLLEEGRYRMDFDDLAAKVADPALTMALLCSPHNPIGRVWTRAELLRFGEICAEHGVLVVADEVFADLVFADSRFTSWGSLGPEFLHNNVICTAASKAFNLSGLNTSNIVIADPQRRQKFAEIVAENGIFGVNTFGMVATEAACRDGEPWLNAVTAYIEDNYRCVVDYLADNLPQVRVIRPESTYLLWLDFRDLNMTSERRTDLLLNQAKIHLESGADFGPEGEGFERMNVACTRWQLVEALDRIKSVFSADATVR